MVVARAAIGLIVVVVTALLWVLVLTMWIEAVRRSIAPISVQSAMPWWL
jgi:hypothetical protein